jgi:hypothetical protein
VQALPEGDRYLGFLFARGDDPAGVEAALRRAHALLEVEILDEPPAEADGARLSGTSYAERGGGSP